MATRSILKHAGTFGFAVLIGVGYWQWKGEAIEESVRMQTTATLGIAVGYLSARRAASPDEDQ